jgi:serine/threonine protein kinase
MREGDVFTVSNYTFRISKRIAEGGMGAVFEADQLGALGFTKRMAIKQILRDLSTDDEYAEMFVGEAKLAAHLIHPNIVQLYHLGRSGNMHYMAMELVDGITLYQFMAHHRRLRREIPYELSAFIASRICRALDYAHDLSDDQGNRLGIVHRDCTPKNIMIDRRGVVKLADFGAAKARHYLKNQEGQILVGKIAYMSPEQAGFLITDGRTDIFSLGVVMWECITNRNLFEEGDTHESLDAIQTQPIEPPARWVPKLPKMLNDIVMKALERDLARRYQTAGEMGRDLEHYLYHDRFGVTDDTLRRYLQRITPELYEGRGI